MRQACFELARRRFADFLPYVKIVSSGVGLVPLELWNHIKETVSDLEIHRLLEIAKSRQIGFTTIFSAYALWHGMFIPSALALDISKGERDAHEFLDKSKAIWEILPPELQVERGLPDNREQMTFTNGGRILALPSTEDAGRGLSPTLAIFDEADFHEYLEAAYNSVKPGLDDRGG